jgi:pyruvate dehydrogenase E2 component (dihydrolipoamide acetyltransferase)
MPIEITMPQLSDTMTEGTVVKWLKKEGDKIKAGETVAEVETDKATMEMESFEGGTLAFIAAPEGTKVEVGKPIAFLATSKEKIEDVKKQVSQGAKTPGTPAPNREGASIQSKSSASIDSSRKENAGGSQSTQTLTAPPERAGVGASEDQGTATFHGASTGEMREPDHSQAHGATRQPIDTAPSKGERQGDGRIRVSPLARRIAQDRGIDLSQIAGSGPGGRIVKQDVLEFASQAPASPEKAEVRQVQPTAAAPGEQVPVLAQRIATGQQEVIPLSKMRSVIALRLQQSKQNIPHFYETVDCDVEELSNLRARLNEQLASQKIKLSLGDLVAKAIASALIEHPGLNAHFNGKEIIRFGDVNLGMAVALPEGLIVPVLRNINQMSLREIRIRSADLVDRARAQRLKQDEMMGATFTVSNLGMFGVREFSAIINPPEVGILAVGGAQKRAVVRGDEIVPRMMMTLTVSCDHRAVDGASAAEFLATLRQFLEEPGLMLV